MNNTVANEIIRQLGGYGKLKSMIGANNFVYDEKSVSFDFKGCKKINKIKIELTPLDLYDLTFFKWMPRKCELVEVEKFDGCYNDNIKELIEEETGLYLSL